jgi:hypothetical protein
MSKKLILLPISIIVLSPVLGVGGLRAPEEVQARVSFVGNGQQLNLAAGRGVALADFNGDGALDAFVVNEAGPDGQYRIFIGDGRGRFSESGQSFEPARGALKPVAFDINGDGSMDVLVGRTVWLNDGHGRMTPDPSRFQDADEAVLWQCRLADLNGDGLVDVLAISRAGMETGARVYLNDGRGHFRQAGRPFGPKIQSSVELGDVNGDGSVDAVISGWRNAAADPCPNRVFLNDGQGRFTDSGQVFDEGPRHSHGLALGDLDRDGDLDLVLVTQQEPFVRLYLNDGKGHFTAGCTLGTTAVEKVAVADLDGDGGPDIFLACIGPNEIWLNDGRGGFADSGLRLGQEWSWEFAVGDMNGDGLPDLFVVNLGIDPAAPPEKRMRGRFAEVWINAGKRIPGEAGLAEFPAAVRIASKKRASPEETVSGVPGRSF